MRDCSAERAAAQPGKARLPACGKPLRFSLMIWTAPPQRPSLPQAKRESSKKKKTGYACLFPLDRCAKNTFSVKELAKSQPEARRKRVQSGKDTRPRVSVSKRNRRKAAALGAEMEQRRERALTFEKKPEQAIQSLLRLGSRRGKYASSPSLRPTANPTVYTRL